MNWRRKDYNFYILLVISNLHLVNVQDHNMHSYYNNNAQSSRDNPHKQETQTPTDPVEPEFGLMYFNQRINLNRYNQGWNQGYVIVQRNNQGSYYNNDFNTGISRYSENTENSGYNNLQRNQQGPHYNYEYNTNIPRNLQNSENVNRDMAGYFHNFLRTNSPNHVNFGTSTADQFYIEDGYYGDSYYGRGGYYGREKNFNGRWVRNNENTDIGIRRKYFEKTGDQIKKDESEDRKAEEVFHLEKMISKESEADSKMLNRSHSCSTCKETQREDSKPILNVLLLANETSRKRMAPTSSNVRNDSTIHKIHGYFGTHCGGIVSSRLDAYEKMSPFTPSVDVMDHSPYTKNPWNQYTSGMFCAVYPTNAVSIGKTDDSRHSTPRQQQTNPGDSLKKKLTSTQTVNNILKRLFQQWDLFGRKEENRANITFKDKTIAKMMAEPIDNDQVGQLPWFHPLNSGIIPDLQPMPSPFRRPSIPLQPFNLVSSSDSLSIPSIGEAPWTSLYNFGFSSSFTPGTSPGFFPRAEQSILAPPRHGLQHSLVQPSYMSKYGHRVPVTGGYMTTVPRFALNNYGYPHMARHINSNILNPYGAPMLPSLQSSKQYDFFHTSQFQSESYRNPFFGKVPWMSDGGRVIQYYPNNIGFLKLGFHPINSLNSITRSITPVDETRNVYFSDPNVFVLPPTSPWACTNGLGCVVWDFNVPRPITPVAGGVPLLRSATGTVSGTGPSSGIVKPSISPGPGLQTGSRLQPSFPIGKHFLKTIYKIKKHSLFLN